MIIKILKNFVPVSYKISQLFSKQGIPYEPGMSWYNKLNLSQGIE